MESVLRPSKQWGQVIGAAITESSGSKVTKSNCASILISVQSWYRVNKHVDQILSLWCWVSEETPIIHICNIINTLGHTATISSDFKKNILSIILCVMHYIHSHKNGFLYWQISEHQKSHFFLLLYSTEGIILLFFFKKKKIHKLFKIYKLCFVKKLQVWKTLISQKTSSRTWNRCSAI